MGALVRIIFAVGIAFLFALAITGLVRLLRTRHEKESSSEDPASSKTEKLEKKREWKWKMNWLTVAGWILALWLICVLSTPILWLIRAPIAAVDYTVRGTDPADHGLWGKSPSPPRPRPAPDQLLRWNADAKVKMREQVSTTIANNGICFVDIVPPNNKPEFKITCSGNELPYRTYLVEHNIHGFRNPWELAQRAVSKEGVRDGIILIDQLSGQGILRHSFFFTNHTGGGREAPVLCEEYLQISDQATREVSMERVPDARTISRQYVVEVGLDECSFNIQDPRFQWLWIAPVHCKDWQLQIGETSVPSKGMAEGAREMFKGLKGDDPSIAPFAITVNLGGKEVPLEKAILLKPKDTGSGKVTLRVNAPQGKWLEGKLKPAKVIVGYQL